MAITYRFLCCSTWIGFIVMGFATAALAQMQKEGDVSAGAPATSVRYHSALERYQAYKDQAVQPWREANDNVGRIGGWRVYAKEAAADGGSTANGRAPDPHAGHPKAKQ